MKLTNAIAAGCLTAAASLYAAPIAYEGFNYDTSTSPTIAGLNGGDGWAGSWEGSTGPTARGGTLSYNTLTGIGGQGKVWGGGQTVYRQMNTQISDGKYFISAMMEIPNNNSIAGEVAVRLGQYRDGNSPLWSHLFGLQDGYAMINDNWHTSADDMVSTTDPLALGTHLFVLEFDFNSLGGTGTANMYIDPDETAGVPLVADLTLTDISAIDKIDTIALVWNNDSGVKIIDEVRVGDTWSDVVPTAPASVPEPSAGLLCIFGLSGLLLRRR